MGFQRVDSSDDYLRITDFEKVDVINKVCYVLDYKSGISVLSKGYFRLMVKTYDDVTVPALLFNVSDFIEKGIDVAGFKNKFVKISGIPNVYNGSYTLQVSEIELVPTKDVRDVPRFLGVVDDLIKMCEDIDYGCKAVNPNFEIPVIWKSKSYPTILNGKLGGYVKFVWQWMFMISIYSDSYGGDLQKIFSKVIIYYAKYLDRLATLAVVTDLDKLNIIKSVQVDDSDESVIIIDTLSSILGLTKPEHLFSHILTSTFKVVEELMFKGELWKSLPRGGARQLNDGYLKKF